MAASIIIQQIGSDVVFSGGGTINLSSLTYARPDSSFPLINAGLAYATTNGAADVYSGGLGPASFGSYSFNNADSYTGDVIGIIGAYGEIFVPTSYVSNSYISGTMTFLNQTISGLGLVSGTYTYTWGSGPTLDTLTINIIGIPIIRPFAYNPTSSPISGTTQVGSLAIGVVEQDYSLNPGGVIWWMGPDESLGYVIAAPVSGNTQPTEISGVTASLGFLRTIDFTDNNFIGLSEYVSKLYNNPQVFSSATYASTWLTNNGFWNSYQPSVTPTPTVTITPTVTKTPTNTPTTSVTPTVTLTPTNTITPTVTQTPTSTPLLTPVTYLVIGGGAGGGSNWGGGGGAGQFVSSTTSLSKNVTYSITIGSGGNGAPTTGQGSNGGTTTFSGTGLSVTAIGGGGGGYNTGPSSATNGSNGASGGGGGGGGGARSTGGSGLAGFSGGSVTLDNSGSGGGGGSSQAGANGTSPGGVGTGGNGGSGTTSNITGSLVAYAGGGGGGGNAGAVAASGGSGGGGNGGNTNGGAGANATGYGSGGGGGATNGGAGGNGSSGVVILSIPTNQLGTYTGSPILTTNGSNTILTFTGNGSYTATSIAPTPTPTQTNTVTPTQTSTVTPSQTNTPTPTRPAYLYYRWQITAAKTMPPQANCVQAAEFVFQIGGVDQSMAGVTVTNPSGNNPVGETPPNLVDNNLTTKALDLNFVSNGNLTNFIFQFSSAKAFTGYRWATANDEESRDPASWTIAGSNNGTTWTTLSTVSNFTATSLRNTWNTAQTY